ncbi:MAG: DNA-directed RNA polymerase subunit beta [Candidatus Portnoybacteria bacterium CG10_big_fil_rev_8_21_14_0_10_38_18]|uniref:DNA-directed RNA polymerase subunit beta n=1 Tax=Candidatus Portnoybacteria bacterium CG10_big_fil_rev_8_21_14_0_10_38_18 TaxID=1974813 RepID=A0A2M8KD05_9BACT|nr:MAG: DNA-directed RNA polymerase subunit beta [Candidatus Portnoybacteria bacterium CG10_big_fil_rev_8_21_14_0_10_38_18]
MAKIKYFSKYPKHLLPLPNLVEIQLNSYNQFFKKGLRELFDEISPIRDYGGKDLALSFGDYYLDEPKCDELRAKKDGLSYEAPLRVKLKLVNKKANETKEQEVFLTDMPLITPRGTFILNGVERVVISQLIRSAGVFFTTGYMRGRKLHGAKIIPNRGAWLEFETEYNGSIVVRIDRKRKIPVTALFRIFGLSKNEDILKEFKDVDNGEIQYIKETLDRDPSKNQDEAWIEIYKRIRPGDLAAIDNAKQLIGNMFNNFERYDLSEVGRYKLNQRLGIKTLLNKENRILRKEDLVLIIKEIIKLNNDPETLGDDIDHLGNRRVRALGELLQNKMRVGLARLERIIRDRMSTLDIYNLQPAQLMNSRPLMAVVKEFFTSSQLSQFMNQINPLSELEHKRRLSAMGPGGLTKERAGFEVRDVHPSHYGRICPIETPEGPNIGLVGHLASYARINPYGFIETPYRRVKKGLVTNEIVYLDAFEEEKYNIAHAGVSLDINKRIKDKRVEARIHGEPGIVDREKIDFIDVSPYQFISIATALIPFVEHDDSNRALMGSNMQRQAVPLVNPEAPLVGTGIEAKAAKDSGQVVVAEDNGTIRAVDASQIVLSSSGRVKTINLHNFLRSNDYTCITQRPIVKKGQKVKKGDILADSSSTDDGELALGQNVLVAFMSWSGANFEDAIILSERLVKNDYFSSVHIEEFICEVRDTKLGPETTTADIPNVGENRLKDLDEEGIIRIGAEMGQDDILVGKISPKGESDLTAEERLLRAIFGDKARDIKDTSLRLPHGKRGRVVGIKIFSREKGDKLMAGVIKAIQVEVAQFRKVAVGDKLAGRHGNKGVISKILPEEDMPHLEDGTPVDIILNPLGVASRMNVGQILETHLGWAANKLGYRAYSPPFSGVTEEEIKQELKKADLPETGKVFLYDGRTGEKFIQPVTVGYIYMMKLNHLVEDKIHMRSIGPYSLITQQPLGGKAQFGGQRFGEMEVWALEGYGAAYSLQEMLTIKSDDVVGRANAYDSIIKGRPIHAPNIPSSFNVLVSELKSLGFSIDPVKKEEKALSVQPKVKKNKT